MELRLIGAVDRSGVIGAGDEVPWDYPEDVEQYRDRVRGHPGIVGRRTFDLMADPPGEPLVVVTRDATRSSDDPDVVYATGPRAAVRMAGRDDPEVAYVLGGEAIYRLFVPFATGAVVSEIPEHADGDVYFPYLGAGWSVDREVDYGTFTVQCHENADPLPMDGVDGD